jgi:hypothetical protein
VTDPNNNPVNNAVDTPVDTQKPTKASKAAPALAASTPPTPADENQGVGGLYEMVDGKRQLVARTQVAQP